MFRRPVILIKFQGGVGSLRRYEAGNIMCSHQASCFIAEMTSM